MERAAQLMPEGFDARSDLLRTWLHWHTPMEIARALRLDTANVREGTKQMLANMNTAFWRERR